MRLWRYCVAAFIYDWFVFVFWTAVPVRAVRDFGASNTQLALLQAASTVPYVLNSLFIGALADRWSKSLLARLGCVVAALACAWTAQAPSLAMLFVGVPLLGIGASIFWPPVQGGIGAETEPARMERALGTFNVMWSLGKAVGFAMAGKLVDDLGHAWVLWISAASALAVVPLYPRDVPVSREPLDAPDVEGRAAYRTMSYVANFAAFGVGATLQNQFFKFLKDAKVATTTMSLETYFGLFLGAVFLAQTAMFFVLQRGARWTYRRWLLYGAQLLSAAALSLSVLLRDPTLLLVVAPLVGVGIGFTYASSIYYSLHGPSDHGRFAGIHEAVLGAGSFVIPLAGGVLADLSGDPRVPFWLAAAVSVASLALQERLFRNLPLWPRRTRRSAPPLPESGTSAAPPGTASPEAPRSPD